MPTFVTLLCQGGQEIRRFGVADLDRMYDDNFIIMGEDVDETEEVAVAKRTSSECLYLITKGRVRYRIVATTTARIGRERWSKTNDVQMTINNECVGID